MIDVYFVSDPIGNHGAVHYYTHFFYVLIHYFGSVLVVKGSGVEAYVARTFDNILSETCDLTEVCELVGVIFDVSEVDDDV